MTIEGMRGTPAYIAPELIDEGKLSPACDVYAFGIIMWEVRFVCVCVCVCVYVCVCVRARIWGN